MALPAFAKTAAPKRVERKIAQARMQGLGEIILLYGKDANNFKNIKLHLTPYSTYMTFKSYEDQEYTLDCQVIAGKSAWRCFSACEGGELQVNFSGKSGFSEITVDPFQITPRLCDGSESEDDPQLTARKVLRFELKALL